MSCRGCSRDIVIVNKHFALCQECNSERLHGSKYGKQYKFIPKKIEFSKAPPRQLSQKRREKTKRSLFVDSRSLQVEKIDKIKLDEDFYELCFNQSDHKCEECSTKLPDIFRDANSKVVARWRYSHIIPKSIASNLRHVVKNINHLCLECHGRWENGDRENMKIYSKNSKRFPNYF